LGDHKRYEQRNVESMWPVGGEVKHPGHRGVNKKKMGGAGMGERNVWKGNLSGKAKIFAEGEILSKKLIEGGRKNDAELPQPPLQAWKVGMCFYQLFKNGHVGREKKPQEESVISRKDVVPRNPLR